MAFSVPVPNDKLYLEQVRYGKDEQKRRKDSPIFVSGDDVAKAEDAFRWIKVALEIGHAGTDEARAYQHAGDAARLPLPRERRPNGVQRRL